MASNEGPDAGKPENENVVNLFTDAGMEEGFAEAEETVRDYSAAVAKASVASIGTLDAIRAEEEDIVKRAKRIVAEKLNRFPEVKVVRAGTGFKDVVASSDLNRYAAFKMLYGTGEEAPHLDEFSSRVKDGAGKVIDNNYPSMNLIEALRILGLEGQSKRTVVDCLYDWGREHTQNDMQIRMAKLTPVWDGVERIEESLVKTFHCNDTELTRLASKYFWLSLHARIFNPGCLAPVVLCLFGTQNAGKSYFSKLICEEFTGNATAAPIQMPMNKPMGNFLREITGQAVIANIGEMIGFGSADNEESKMRVTSTTDTFDYKYEGSVAHPRQWVIVMDGNKYEGLQRDETGNRRYYPIFVGQVDDKNGKPEWRKVFSIDYSDFRNEMWRYMAEAAAWFEEYGFKAYEQLCSKLANDIFQFSAEEMRNDRGTIRDYQVDNHIVDVLFRSQSHWWTGKGKNEGKSGVFFSSSDLGLWYGDITGQRNIPYKKLKQKLESFGAVYIAIGKGRTGYLFTGYENIDQFYKTFFSDGSDTYEGAGELGAARGTNYIESKKGGF